jgi:fructose-1,6-bisphosphatase/inositol monophosphatase family enzyme
LLVREAGGVALSIDGSQLDLMGRNILVAASEELAKETLEAVRIYKADRDFPEPCLV